jgi:hypothetical protein
MNKGDDDTRSLNDDLAKLITEVEKLEDSDEPTNSAGVQV